MGSPARLRGGSYTHLVLQFCIVADVGNDAAGISVLESAQQAHVLLVAAAHQHHLHRRVSALALSVS